MHWSFINSFICIFCLWDVNATVEITPSMFASLYKLTFWIFSRAKLRKLWKSSNNNQRKSYSPSPKILPLYVFQPALHNQQTYAMSYINVNKQNFFFSKIQSELWVMKVWCTATMGTEKPLNMNEQHRFTPMVAIAVTKRVLTVGCLFSPGATWPKLSRTVNMRHFIVSTFSRQAYSYLAQLSVYAGQWSNFFCRSSSHKELLDKVQWIVLGCTL